MNYPKLGTAVWAAVIVVAVFGLCIVGYDCGRKSADSKIADLSTQLAQNEKTTEIKDNLYATKIVEMNNLQNLLDGSDKTIASLKQQISDSEAQLLSTQQLVIKWKNAYQGAVNATQTTQPSTTDPTIERKRVDFTGDLGPIHVSGNTLTDPPEAFLKLEQTKPLTLSVNVVRNKDGTWSSLVTSSDPNIGVDVKLAGVDPGVISPTWKQRIWADVGADFLLSGKRASAGLSYHFDNYSIGASCSVWDTGQGCGLTAGFRIFR